MEEAVERGKGRRQASKSQGGQSEIEEFVKGPLRKACWKQHSLFLHRSRKAVAPRYGVREGKQGAQCSGSCAYQDWSTHLGPSLSTFSIPSPPPRIHLPNL